MLREVRPLPLFDVAPRGLPGELRAPRRLRDADALRVARLPCFCRERVHHTSTVPAEAASFITHLPEHLEALVRRVEGRLEAALSPRRLVVRLCRRRRRRWSPDVVVHVVLARRLLPELRADLVEPHRLLEGRAPEVRHEAQRSRLAFLGVEGIISTWQIHQWLFLRGRRRRVRALVRVHGALVALRAGLVVLAGGLPRAEVVRGHLCWLFSHAAALQTGDGAATSCLTEMDASERALIATARLSRHEAVLKINTPLLLPRTAS